jgi:hypothetical protein
MTVLAVSCFVLLLSTAGSMLLAVACLTFPSTPAGECISIGAYSQLADNYTRLQNEEGSLAQQLGYAQQQNQALSSQLAYAKQPPYTVIRGRQVEFVFKKLNGDIASWTLPFDSYDQSLQNGAYYRNTPALIPTKKLVNGKTFIAKDYTMFVQPQPFSNVTSQLYAEAGSDEQFVNEVFNIVKQGEDYVPEITDTPRYPLETLVGGGGDCEDSAVLTASMLHAANSSWKVQLVYMDSNHPYDDVQDVNHVAVYVDTGSYATMIETTSKTQMNPYSGKVSGWFFDV